MSQIIAVLKKDLLIEWRTASRTVALISFSAILLLILSFAIGADSKALQQHASAYIWIAVLLSSTMLLERSFRLEIEAGALHSLLLGPVKPAALFYGKALATTAQLMLLAVVTLPLVVVFCDAQLQGEAWVLWLTIVLGTAGLAAPGTLYAAMIARIQGRQLMLPLLLFPLVVPVLVAAVKATSLAMLGDPMDQAGSWMALLGCFNLVYWGLAGVLFGRVLET
jgi:heme exporter protein B